MAWRTIRNPQGDGYIVVEDQPDGSQRAMRDSDGVIVYGSERAAQDAVDQDNAFDSGGAEGYGEMAAEVAERRRSASDPAEQRQRLDRGEARDPYADPYSDDSSGEASEFDEGSADVPIWGWLSGAQARRDAARAEREADAAESGWDELGNYMPTPNDLAVDYGEEGFIEGPGSRGAEAEADPMSIEAQREVLQGLQSIVRNQGMTPADRARQQLAYEQAGMAARAQRDADFAQLQARGMGGSGASVASMLSAQQGAAQARSQQDAAMLIEAQRRHMQALQGYGAAAGQMRGQSFDEDAYRGHAADAYNEWETNARRESQRFNTQQRDRSGESRSRGRQQAYENRERQQAGRTNQWTSAAGGRRQDQARQDEANQAAGSAVGTLLEEIL